MKKQLLFVLGIFLLQTISFAQASFSTGGIGINVSNYGRVRVLDGTGATRQIDRSSLLVAKNSADVFDYNENAETVEPATLVTTPLKSDYEIYCAINSAYEPTHNSPNLDVKINVYSWNNAPFAIAKFTIKSNETAAFNAVVGIEMIAQIEGVYGNELMKFHAASSVLELSTTKFVGYKILSANPGIVNLVDWYDGYNVDSSYYKWMTTPMNNDSLLTGPDGGVAFLNQAGKNLAPGDSMLFYVGISFGSTRAEMLQNMNLAVAKYPTLGTNKDQYAAKTFTLEQNYPNPFNPATVISYTVAEKAPVSLKVFDVLGNEVTTLVNGEVAAGAHQVTFDASKLSTGVYMYRLQTGTTVQTRKMVYMK